MMAPRPQLFQAIVLVVCSAFSIPAQAQCTWFKDRDADGFGDPASTTSAPCHVALPGYVLNKRDCNDTFLNAAEWAMVGAAAVDPDAAVMTDLEIAVDGTLYVLYRKNTGSNPTAVVAVHMFNGTSWVAVGPDPVNFSDQMYAADLALDGNGVPYIAFADGDVGGKVTVIRYNSSSGSWAVVGSRGMSAQDVISDGTASLAFDGNNIPHVFYVSPSGDAFVMRYDPAGNVWQELGGGAFASAGSTEYSLKIGISNIPYAVFTESDTRISVMRFAGSWQVVGSRSFSDDYISFPSLTLDADDNPYAAYFDNGLQQVIVQRYDAASTSWVKLGGAIFNDVSEVSVAVDRLGVPYAAYNGNQKLTVVKWDGTSWAVVANTEFADGLHISLAIAQDNFPYVSFLDRNSRLAKVMTIMPIHVPADQPTLAATATSTCAGETTQLSIRTGNLNEAAAWVWYSGDCDTGTRLGTGLTLDVAPTVTTTYYARGEGACVDKGDCGSITINVTPVPTAPTLSATRSSVCPGGSTQLRITGGTLGDATTQNWAWYKETCGDVTKLLGTGTPITVNPLVTTTYYARGEGSCVGLCASIVIQVIDLPVATAPASTTAMVCAGTTGTLTVTPVSNVASYQWRVRNGVSWSDITGQTTATLSRAAADLQTYPAENEYSVVLKNSLGCEQTLTGLKILSFTQPAIGTAGQPAGVTVCAGANTAFQVNATGTSLVYQWQVDAGSGFTNITNGGVYAGSTTARLELTGATAALNGYQYRALVKTVVGGNTICNAVESDPAVLTINTEPSINPGGQPANISICPNGTATFSVAALSYVTPTYQWQENTGTGFADLADGGSYSGVTTATLSISGVASTWTGRRYRVVIQNACGPVTSDGAATLSVTSGISIRGQPASVMACPGSTANFQVSATMGGLTYQWQEDSGSGFQNLAASGTYSGVVSSTLVINNVSTSLNGRRYRVVIQSSGCASVNSDGAAVLTVNTPPAIVNQPSDVVLCLGESNNMTVAATGPAVTYQWQAESGGNFTDIIEGSVYSGAHAGTLAILQPPGSMNGYRFRAVLKWACGEVTSAPAVLSINLPPDISAGPDKTIEQRGSVVLEGTVPSGVVTYEWMELAGTPQANEIQPEVTPATDTYYTLSATDSHGCTATDQVMVAVTPLFNIPNAFSPNHDGVNDAWVINGLEQYPNARIKVFNRYGAPVFALENQPVSWDGSCQGKPLPWGTYYYTIDLQDGHKPLSGWVLIMN